MSGRDLATLKRTLSPQVLRVAGVSGIGLPAEGLTIYLAEDSERVRGLVQTILDAHGVQVPVHWEVTGKITRLTHSGS